MLPLQSAQRHSSSLPEPSPQSSEKPTAITAGKTPVTSDGESVEICCSSRDTTRYASFSCFASFTTLLTRRPSCHPHWTLRAGPGDARPTAVTIVKDEGLESKLSGKVMLVTGCSSGIGIETARALLATGAHVFVTARDTAKGQQVVEGLQTSTAGSGGRMDLLQLDLNSLQSVRKCAEDFLARSKQLNALILNAGKWPHLGASTDDSYTNQQSACCCLFCRQQGNMGLSNYIPMHCAMGIAKYNTGVSQCDQPSCRAHYTASIATERTYV